MLVGEKAEQVGKEKVFQVHGKWYGKDLDESGECVVDIIELIIVGFSKALHPLEVIGNTFDQMPYVCYGIETSSFPCLCQLGELVYFVDSIGQH